MIEKWDDELAPRGPKAFCPNCGAPRARGDKFCPACGKLFDAAPVPAGTTPAPAAPASTAPSPPNLTNSPTPTEPSKPRGHGNLISAVAILLVLGLPVAIYLTVNGGERMGNAANNTTVQNPDIPPTGQIWFGSSFDTTTFAINGQTSTFSQGSTVALVAHLTKAISAGQANMRIELNGTTITNQVLNNMTGSGEVFGMTVPLTVPGTWAFTVTDIGGNTLGTGSLTVR